MLVSLLLACTTESPPDLAVVQPVAPELGEPDPLPHPECVRAAADPSDLPVDWCLRVSPEPGDVWPDDHGGSAGGQDADTDEAIDLPRCGVFNVLGVFGSGGPVDAPSTLYCDADGGLRLAVVEGFRQRTSYQHLQDSCVAVPDGGALVPDGDGWRGWWLGRDRESAIVVHQVVIGADHVATDSLIDVHGVLRITPVVGDPARVVGFDEHGGATLFDADGVTSEALPVRDHVSAVAAGEAVLFGGCDESAQLTIVLHGAVDEVLVAQDGCWPWAPPRVAWGAGGWAAGWQDDTGSTLVVNGVATVFPEGGTVGLTADGDAFVATVGGAVLRLDASGAVLAERRHPILAGAGDDLDRVDLAVVDGRVRYQVVHLSAVSVGEHIYGYNRLELSATAAP